MFWGNNPALMYSSETPIFQLSSCNYKNHLMKMIQSQKGGGIQEDTDVVGLYFAKMTLTVLFIFYNK